MQFIRTDSEQIKEDTCFVVMPFGKKPGSDGVEFDWDEFYDDFITTAAHEAGLTAVRADDIYGSTPIVENLWGGMKEAAVVVVDLTGRSPNVLYELGLAHALGKRVVLVIQDANDIPADLMGLTYLEYSMGGTGGFRYLKELTKHIQAARDLPSTECTIMPMADLKVEQVTAEIMDVTADHASLKLPGNRLTYLRAEDMDWAYKPSSLLENRRLPGKGESLEGFYYTLDGEKRFSPQHPRENLWPIIVQKFVVGHEFRGRVHSYVPALGAFIRVQGLINGLLHNSQIPEGISLNKDDEVDVRVSRMDATARNIQLEWAGAQSASQRPSAPVERPAAAQVEFPFGVGDKLAGVIVRFGPANNYVLIDVAGREKAVILPTSMMSAECVRKLEAQELNVGDAINVEVAYLSAADDRVTVKDVGDLLEGGSEGVAQE